MMTINQIMVTIKLKLSRKYRQKLRCYNANLTTMGFLNTHFGMAHGYHIIHEGEQCIGDGRTIIEFVEYWNGEHMDLTFIHTSMPCHDLMQWHFSYLNGVIAI